jgi:HSP20 family molecular chaperone IbpA
VKEPTEKALVLERRFGRIRREIHLPEAIEFGNVRAGVEAGVLAVEVQKSHQPVDEVAESPM